jgi:hypothetical protein
VILDDDDHGAAGIIETIGRHPAAADGALVARDIRRQQAPAPQ